MLLRKAATIKLAKKSKNNGINIILRSRIEAIW